MTESLGWTVTETVYGLRAEGESLAHAATADFQIQVVGSDTRVDIALVVERAGTSGFMLFDVGGYYNIQIRNWLDGIQLAIHQTLSGATEPGRIPAPNQTRTTARIFNGCLLLSFIILGLWFLGNFISAIIGLITGTLYIWGKGGTLVLHGSAARIVATLIILFGAFLSYLVTKSRRRKT